MDIFHITPKTTWEQAVSTGSYLADSLSTEGFIHCSTREQVLATANRFYHGQPGLVLLEIDPACLDACVKHENLEGGAALFPHIYGALNLNAVVRVFPFVPNMDGNFSFPE
jgi:uncharacterized protein (DUF952 family)